MKKDGVGHVGAGSGVCAARVIVDSDDRQRVRT
jgi:hypothetical protein